MHGFWHMLRRFPNDVSALCTEVICTMLQLCLGAQGDTVDETVVEATIDNDHSWGRGAGGPGEHHCPGTFITRKTVRSQFT